MSRLLHSRSFPPRPLARAILGACLLLLWLLGHPGPAMAQNTVPDVKLNVVSSENPERHVELPPGSDAAIRKTLAEYRHLVDSADVVLDQVEVDPYLTEDFTDSLTKYSVALTLKNGSRLSSQLRRVPEPRLAAAVIESIQRCIRRYQTHVGDEDKTLFMSNL